MVSTVDRNNKFSLEPITADGILDEGNLIFCFTARPTLIFGKSK